MTDIEKQIYSTYLESTGVSTDTRTIKEGNVFFALKGPSFNGNEYAIQAFSQGAFAVVLDEIQDELLHTLSSRIFYVDDVLKTLQTVAKYHRTQLSAHVIGLTGSNGKTTTKELLYSIMKRVEKETYCTQGNLNNHIGVPLTLLSIPMSAKYAIVEMGTNQPGDIEELCSFSQPDFGLITNIGKTHLEKLKSQEGVFHEKISLFYSVKQKDGVFFQNVGDVFLKNLDTKDNVLFSSSHTATCDIRSIDDDLALSFYLEDDTERKKVITNLFGNYNIENIAAALSVAGYFEIPTDQCIKAIEGYTPSNMRSQIIRSESNTILLDAYNSNPFSLRGSLTHFLESKGTKKVAIIGDMLELGDHAENEHLAILELAQKNKSTDFIFVGNIFYSLKDARVGNFYKSVNNLIKDLQEVKISDANILIKGSRSIRLEKTLDYLKN